MTIMLIRKRQRQIGGEVGFLKKAGGSALTEFSCAIPLPLFAIFAAVELRRALYAYTVLAGTATEKLLLARPLKISKSSARLTQRGTP
jgi:hypothetical protein